MELKHGPPRPTVLRLPLLIVPYGIETSLCVPRLLPECLLIVPYGIETLYIR